MQCDECGGSLYHAGDLVPAGTYLRIDDGSFRRIVLQHAGALPATFGGHVAEYRDDTRPCLCVERQLTDGAVERAVSAGGRDDRRSVIEI